MSAPAHHRLAVDVGGTFIDYILLDERDGSVVIDKQPATASALADEFVRGLQRLPVAPSELSMFIHGTTVALNTLVQERGAKTALLTTAGFRDVLELGRAGRPAIYDLRYQPAEPLVPRYLRREVTERTAPDGAVLVPLDLDAVRAEVEFLAAHGVEAVAICFLHAYANPAHEAAVAELVRAMLPGVSVTASSELVREWREYERTATTVANAYTQPLFSRYAATIDSRVQELGYSRGVAFMRSNGGVMTLAAAGGRPVETLGSGPAGGVIGAHALSQRTGIRDIVCADVGGTTYDVALIQDGEIVERSNTDIAGRPVMGSVIDIVSVGAGGGSIASIDPTSGSLRVGPESAGASPGPAAFGLGGELPTVTDAQVVLGLLDPDRFLGGRMKLDRERAETALSKHLGEHRDLTQLAGGVMAIAQANMANAIRIMTTQRGLDPRGFAMLSFGGGGGLFAAGVAEELGITSVLVPQAAAGFSAWGMLTADYREDATLTRVHDVDAASAPDLRDAFARLAEEARASLVAYGFEPGALQAAFSADVRFRGQDHTITTPVEPSWLDGDAAGLVAHLPGAFAARHRQRYGHGEDGAAVQVVTLRCRAIAPVTSPRTVGVFAGTPAHPVAHRRVWFPATGWVEQVPVYEREQMSADDVLAGPCVLDEWTTTVIVPPGWTAALDEHGTAVLTHELAHHTEQDDDEKAGA